METQPPRFYFALPRLMSRWRGGDAVRAEENAAEAWIAGVAIYILSYLFFAKLIPDHMPWWQLLPLLVVLAFMVLLFWVLVLHLNALLIRVLRSFGLLRQTLDRHVQSLLIGTIATIMAGLLLKHGSWPAEIAAIWITALVMNLVAAATLNLTNGTRAGH